MGTCPRPSTSSQLVEAVAAARGTKGDWLEIIPPPLARSLDLAMASELRTIMLFQR
jgi:hypothetical protein